MYLKSLISRAAPTLFVFAVCAACGGLLGFSDDDSDEGSGTTAVDDGGDARSASGSADGSAEGSTGEKDSTADTSTGAQCIATGAACPGGNKAPGCCADASVCSNGICETCKLDPDPCQKQSDCCPGSACASDGTCCIDGLADGPCFTH